MTLIVALMNSPVLDPYRLAAYNQAERLKSGKIAPEDFDYIYAHFNLGRYGNQVLAEISGSDSETIKHGVSTAMSVEPAEYFTYTLKNIPPAIIRREIISGAKVYPEGRTLTEAQIKYFVDEWGKNAGILYDVDSIAFVFMDVEKYARNLILFTENAAMVYTLKDDTLTPAGLINGTFTPEELIIRTEEPQFMELFINGNLYQVLR